MKQKVIKVYVMVSGLIAISSTFFETQPALLFIDFLAPNPGDKYSLSFVILMTFLILLIPLLLVLVVSRLFGTSKAEMDLVALGKLLRLDETLLLTYKKFWSEYNGKDALMEAMFDPSVAKGKLLFEKNYRAIAKVFDLPEEERANAVKNYLTNWYASMKNASWYDGHKIAKTGGATNYIGYWCFEAAAVTVLQKIDDTSFRDMDYYPKDLVDFYRKA